MPTSRRSSGVHRYMTHLVDPSTQSRSTEMNRAPKSKTWIEIASAPGVILGLGLVAWELRQNTDQAVLNTRAVEVAAYQDLIAQISELNRIVLENSAFADLQLRSFAGDTSLKLAEQNQMTSYLWMLFRHGDMVYYQFEQGVLELERLESVINPLRNRLTLPGMNEEWATRRPFFAPSFQMYIDSLFDLIGG